jgi:hypothetical protein
MGIRIHKCIGYGLADVKIKDYEIDDDRFYELGAGMNIGDNSWCKTDFIKYLKYNSSCQLNIHLLSQLKHWELYDSLIYEPEYGIDNIFLIIPPGYTDWDRYDDIIDYVECENGRVNNYYKILNQGIFPYSGFHQNQYGKRLNSNYSCEWWRYYNLVLDEDIKQEDISGINLILDQLSKKMGFQNFHDCKDNIRPLVPDIIRLFCEWSNIFIDPMTINQLQPMTYTYWS